MGAALCRLRGLLIVRPRHSLEAGVSEELLCPLGFTWRNVCCGMKGNRAAEEGRRNGHDRASQSAADLSLDDDFPMLRRWRSSCLDLDCEASVDEMVQELYAHFRGGRCHRCDPGSTSVMSLVDYCVDTICRHILQYEELPPGLPTELVDRILASLIKHRALVRATLHVLRHSDLTTLDLSSSKDVRDDWLAPLGEKSLTDLNLNHCTALTDNGVLQLKSLRQLRTASLRGCLGLRDRATMVLTFSSSLTQLDLTDCKGMGDEAVRNIRHLSSLSVLKLEGCRALTDHGLYYLSDLSPSLTHLNLAQCDQLTDSGVTRRLVHLTKLQVLDLGYCPHLSNQSLRAVGSRLPGLTHLVVDKWAIDDHGLPMLGSVTGLVRLSMRGCGAITDAGVCRLPASLTDLDVSHCRGLRRPPSTLPLLTSLNVSHGSLRDADLPPSHQLLQSLPVLTDLNLDSCPIGDTGVECLSHLPSLTSLNLADTHVTDAGLEALGRMSSLSSLSLFYCAISDAGIRHLSTLTNLTHLNLDNRDITDSSMCHIAGLSKLKSLDVFSARVSDVGLGYLTALTSLTGLELCGGRVTDRGLQSIGKLTALRSLNLSQNLRVTNTGLHQLSRLRSLTLLNVSHCQVEGPGAVEALMNLQMLETLAVNGCRGMSDPAVKQLRLELPCLKHVRGL